MSAPPFDADRLDTLLDEAGIEVLLATSPHSTRYLTGGYRFFLYDTLPSIGLTQYLPVVVYMPGRHEASFYVGAGNEAWGTDVHPIWLETHQLSWGAADAVRHTAALLRARGLQAARLGIEAAWLPAEALTALGEELPAAAIVDAVRPLEELRMIKTPGELQLIRRAASANVDSMLATFAEVRVGDTTAEIAQRLRLEQTRRELDFAYCLIAAGADHGRAPSPRRVVAGDVVSLDSGTGYRGYVADCVRMGMLGEPTERMVALLADVNAVQAAVRAAITPGRPGGELFDIARERIAELRARDALSFLAHGTGLLTHEAPRLTATGSPPYPADHADRPLAAGMVLSVETHVADPEAGFIKLEDTLIVGPEGAEPVGDHGRDWNRIDA